MHDPERAKRLCSLLSPKPFPSQPDSYILILFFSVLGGGCLQNPFIPVVKARSVETNLKGDVERWGLYPGRGGLGRDRALLSGEGNPLGYTFTLALASPHEALCGQT